MFKCPRCGWTTFDDRPNHDSACPANFPKILEASKQFDKILSDCLLQHGHALRKIDWNSRDPDALPLSDLRALLQEVRALRSQLAVLDDRAEELQAALARSIAGLERERVRRLDLEYEWSYPDGVTRW